MSEGVRLTGLRQRLVLQAMAITLVASVALILSVQLLLAANVKRETSALLSARADAVLGTLTVDGSGELSILETPNGDLDRNAWVFDGDGRLIDGSFPTGALGSAIKDMSTGEVSRAVTVDDSVRLLAVPVPDRKGAAAVGVVVVAMDLTPYEASERYALIVSLILGAVLVAAAGLIAWWTSHRALSPVAAMAARAADWSEHSLDRRFDTGPGGDEIAALGRTLDRLLDRVAGTIRAEQRLSSELAHELRTPLATLRAQAELAQLSTGDDDVADALDRVLRCADTMDETISALMTLARAQTIGPFQPSPIADSVRRALKEVTESEPDPASGPKVDMVDHSGGAAAAAPMELVVRILAPILDNAVRHAAATVAIDVSTVDGHLEVTVTDDGIGLGEHDRESLFEPGVRFHSGDGAGLGLALSRRIARGVGGDVVSRPASTASGAVFVAVLALAHTS